MGRFIDGVQETFARLRQVTRNDSKIEVPRAIQLISMTQLMSTSGVNEDGDVEQVTYEHPWFLISPEERLDIYRKSAFIHSIISARMNQIGSLSFQATYDNRGIQETINKLKYMKSIHKDLIKSDLIEHRITAAAIEKRVRTEMPDCLPGLINFESSIVRLNRLASMGARQRAADVTDWLNSPNEKEQSEDILKKIVNSYLLHGNYYIYKKREGNRTRAIYALPAGTMFQSVGKEAGSRYGYIQIITGSPNLIYSPEEITHDQYLPIADSHYGVVPIEALTTKVAEELLSSNYWANQADGTRPPEKLIAVQVGKDGYGFGGSFTTEMNEGDRERLKEAVQTAKRGAIDVIKSMGPAQILDISRENMGPFQLERLREIKKDAAAVFGMTSIEMNESGSDSVSGRSVADAQIQIDKTKGQYPIIKSIEQKFQTDIIPSAFGAGFNIRLVNTVDNSEELERAERKFKTGLYSANHILTNDLNEEPYDKDEYNYPPGQSQPVQNAIEQQIENSISNARK